MENSTASINLSSIITEPLHQTKPRWKEKTFRDLGKRLESYAKNYRILIIGSKPNNPNPMFYGTEQAAKALDATYVPNNDKNLKYKIPKHDIVMYQGGLPIHHKYHELLDDALSFFWFNDLREPPEDLSYFSHGFVCFPSDSWRNKLDVTYMPQGTPVIEPRRVPKERSIDDDIVFIGSVSNGRFHKMRPPLIKKLRDSGLTVNVLNAPDRSNRRRINAIKAWYLYPNTPICLSSSPPARLYTSNRTYNILGLNGFCLINHFPGIEKLFENKKHVVWYKSNDEAVELAQYYLENEEERKRIANTGYRLALEKHTIMHRILNMLDVVTENDDSFQGFLL